MSEKKSIEICNNEIPVIDMRENVWTINVKNPDLEDEVNADMANSCITNKFFVMCWVSDEYRNINKEKVKSKKINKSEDKLANEFLNSWKNDDEVVASGAEKAFNNYTSIRSGDYVLWNFNSHYYIGKVVGNIKYFGGERNFFEQNESKIDETDVSCEITWGYEVQKWLEFCSDTLLPSLITGRTSKKNQSTIEKVDDLDIKIYVKNIYEHNEEAETDSEKISISSITDVKFDGELKLKLNKDNFSKCLNYMELEDLVYLYILNQKGNEDYYLLPSSCKISKEKYEFNLLSINKNDKPITCQVKNRKAIDLKNYLLENAYKKIYLYSGVNINKEEIDMQNECLNVEIIENEELFDFLKGNGVRKELKGQLDAFKTNLARWYNFESNGNKYYENLKSTLKDITCNKARSFKHPIKVNDNDSITDFRYCSFYAYNYDCVIRLRENHDKDFNKLFSKQV